MSLYLRYVASVANRIAELEKVVRSATNWEPDEIDITDEVYCVDKAEFTVHWLGSKNQTIACMTESGDCWITGKGWLLRPKMQAGEALAEVRRKHEAQEGHE